jgi:hypothetical protein
LVYADDVNLLGDNIDNIKKNKLTIVDANMKVGLEENTEKTKYMLLSRHQNAGQNHDIKIDNRWFENVAQFRYLGPTITNQNLNKFVFWDLVPCSCGSNRRFGGTCRLHLQGR